MKHAETDEYGCLLSWMLCVVYLLTGVGSLRGPMYPSHLHASTCDQDAGISRVQCQVPRAFPP